MEGGDPPLERVHRRRKAVPKHEFYSDKPVRPYDTEGHGI